MSETENLPHMPRHTETENSDQFLCLQEHNPRTFDHGSKYPVEARIFLECRSIVQIFYSSKRRDISHNCTHGSFRQDTL
jgi:hypothetical protein